MKTEDISDLGWHGGGATLQHMSLLNMLIICGSKPLVDVFIMVTWLMAAKNDEFITFFQWKNEEFDQAKKHTYWFFMVILKCKKWELSFEYIVHMSCIFVVGSMSCDCF